MPRDPTINVALVVLPATFESEGAAANVTGWTAINYEVANPLEPLLARIHVPQITVASLNATATFTIQDTTVAGQTQTLQTGIYEGVTAAGTGPTFHLEVPFIPANLAALANPSFQGPRTLNIQMATSAGKVKLVASATVVPFLQIINLARQ